MSANYLRRILSKLTGKRAMYFLVENPYSASSTTRGHMISRQLQRKGFYSFVFDLRYESRTDYQKIKKIKNSVFIIIKRAFLDNENLFTVLKENGNIFIWDPMDELANLKGRQELEMFNGVIWANRQCQKDMSSYLPKDCRGAVIHHHWDPKCRQNHAQGYRLVYLGDPTPENISDEHIRNIEDINIERCSNIKAVKENGLFTRALEYNCHFSVRKEDSESFKYKPNSKLAIAAGMYSNIVLSRDCSHVELLDASYPYYTSSDLKSTKEMVEYSKETYGTKVWKDALEMMREVRERTSIERIGEDYIQLVNGVA